MRPATAAAAALGGCVLVGTVTWRRIQRAGRARAQGHADMLVVLGAALDADGTPCQELAQRLDKAAGLFGQGAAGTILCCGGQDEDGRSEAEAMRAYLVQRGVPRRAVRVDDDGPTTRRAVAAVRRHDAEDRRLVFVTSHYHMHRVLREAERQSLAADGHATDPGRAGDTTGWPGASVWTLLQAVREIAAVWWYALPVPDRDRLIRRRIEPPTPQRLMASAATKWPVSLRVGHRSIASKRSTR